MFKKTQLCVAALTAMAGTAVWAQDAQPATTDTQQPAAQTQRVEITGSRIRSVDVETSQPVQKISKEQIQASGLVTVGDIVSAISSAGSPDISRGAVLASGSDVGGQFVNLRNLGTERLLVLVDGKRWTQSVNGITDVSTIPSSMIDRVEILKDGASAIYGSDAIAGVLNFILKKSLDGGEVSVYAGANRLGDNQSRDFSLSYGANGERGSMMFGLNVSSQGVMWAKDREITSSSFGPELLGAGFGTGPWGRIRQVNPSNGLGTGFNYYLNHTGIYDGVGIGEDSRDPASYHTPGSGDDLFNSTQQMMFASPSDLKSIFTRGTYELSSDVRFTATALYAQRNSSRQIAGYPLNSASQPGYKVYVDKDSYFNPYGSQAVGNEGGPGEDLFFYRRMIEIPRISDNSTHTLHVDAGLNGEFNLGSKTFSWDAGYNYNKVDGTVAGSGNLNLVNLKRALGPSFMNAQGQVQCGTPDAPIQLTQCVPFDILGGPSASTPEALAYVNALTTGRYGSNMTSLTANMSGELFDMPAGAFAMAAGLEYRKISGYDVPDVMSSAGYTTDLAAGATSGGYNVKEGYVELNIPLLKNMPAAELLALNLASRHSRYSNFGSTTNSKGSFTWRPYSDLLIRGTYAQGFRAPSLGDTFGGGSQSFDTFLDPCDSAYGAANSNPETAARCAAAGVSPTFRQVAQSGLPVGGGGAQSTSPFQAGSGNADLQPEKAKTKTIGLVFSPKALPDLSLALDWYKITVDNRITALTANYILGQCYVQGVQQFCDAFRRDPVTGQVTYLERGNANLGQVEASGFDIDVGYRFPASEIGRFGINAQTSFVSSYKIKSTPTSDWINYAGEYPFYKVKSNIAIDWKMGDWGVNFMTRVYGNTKSTAWNCDPEEGDVLYCSTPGGEWSGGTGYNKLGMKIYNDLSVSYKFGWNGTLLAGVNNVFNRKPFINFDAATSATAVDADLPVDRFFFVRYTQQF